MTDKSFDVIQDGNPAKMSNKRSKKAKLFSTIGIIGLIIISFSIGVFAGREVVPEDASLNPLPESEYTLIGDVQGSDQNLGEIDFDLFWQVWDQMRRDYVEEGAVTEEEMFYGALKGLVNSYEDPATVFLTPEETQEFDASSAGSYFSGIGAELGYKNGQIVVISPIKGSPAIEAGIRPGDIILEVDGEPIDPNESIYDVVFRIRGEEGTEVVLTVLHPGANSTEKISIIRGQITVPSMDLERAESNSKIMIFDVGRFTDSSPQAWQDNWDMMVEEFKNSNAEAIVIDLRGNPGGYVTSAVHAASEFMEKGSVVSKMESRTGELTEYKVERKGELLDVPIIVLVNEGSASASEILSGALQKNSRAKVVGVKTYGKGTAQDIVDLQGGSSLHITVMKWLLPDGQWISPDNPITPDYEIELSDDDFKNGDDPQLDKAIELLLQEI